MRHVLSKALLISSVPFCALLAAQEPVAAQEPAPVETTVSETSTVEEAQVERAAIFARVLAKGKVLWSGDLVIGDLVGASVRYRIADASKGCENPVDRRFGATNHDELELNIRRWDRDLPLSFRVRTKWTRGAEECSEPGDRTTGFTARVNLTMGETQIIDGDGGLRLELTARDQHAE